MFSVPRIVTFLTVYVVLASPTIALQQSRQPKEPSGTISGRVTINDQPARGVIVLLLPSGPRLSNTTTSKATTDNDGRFQLRGLPAGGYQLQAFAPALVTSNLYGRQAQIINLNDGESVDGIDLALKPGGVITGRITNADGEPVIQENVRLISADASKRPIYFPYIEMMSSTDDRGIYRLFGVPPGKYLVAVGGEPNGPAPPLNGNNTYYHPGTSDDSKATSIDVTAGSESNGVDIVIGRSKAYSVSGRIVDAISGKPIVGMAYGYGVQDPQTNNFRMTFYSGSTSNASGQFLLQGVSPGQYAAYAQPSGETDRYSDLAPFTVSDSDVGGLIVKLHVGSQITGNVIIEGAERQTVPNLSQIQLSYSSGSPNVWRRGGLLRIGSDGSFRITGIPRGIVRFYPQPYYSPKGLTLSRIERDGIEQKDAIEVGSDEEITGVKIIFSYGTGVISGQVKVEGGEITSSTMMFLNIRRVGSKDNVSNMSQPVDARGRFVASGFVPGEYEITLNYQSRPSSPDASSPAVFSRLVKQTVSVTNRSETQVTLIVDLTKEQ